MRYRTFTLRPPRHPLLRALAALAAAVVAAGLFIVGSMAAAAVLLAAGGSLLVRRWRQRGNARAHAPAVIEGEYTVVSPARTMLPRAD